VSAEKIPYLPFLVDRWETDGNVKAMGPATRYCYVSLLFHQWREGSIPENPEDLKRLLAFPSDPGVNGSLDLDSCLSQVIERFPKVGHGKRANQLLSLLRRAALTQKSVLSASGKRGRLKQITGHPTGQAQATPPATPNKSKFKSNLNSNEEHKEQTKAPAARVAFELPAWIPAEPWGSYLEMRIRIRKPATRRAMELTVIDLEKLTGKDPKLAESILNQSTQKSWQGVFPLNGGSNGTNRGSVPTKEAVEKWKREHGWID